MIRSISNMNLSGSSVFLGLATRSILVSFIAIFCSIWTSTAVHGDERSQLKHLILDAQAENIEKFESGQMHAIVIRSIKGRGTATMESRVQWDASTRYWEYRVHDPDGVYRGKGQYTNPLGEAPIEHMLRNRDRLIMSRAAANFVLVQEEMKAGRPYGGYEFFEITPDPLWKICCIPYAIGGRPWKEMLDRPFVSPDAGEEVRFERLDQGIVRMTVNRLEDNSTTICDFSLHLAGNLIRFESHAAGNPDADWSISNEWINEGGAVRLVRSKMLMGGKDEATAKQSLEILVRSMRPGTGKVQMTLEKIVAMMPKNARVVDQIRDKSYPVDPRANGTIADIQLKNLADEVKKGEFLNR